MQHRMVLNRGRDEMSAFGAKEASGSENGEVITFRAATREHDFAWFGAPDLRYPIVSFIEQSTSAPTDMVDARRISEDIAQERQHRLANRRIERRRGIIIEIDRAH